MTPESLVLLAVAAPFAGAPLIAALKASPNVREAVSVLAGLVTFAANFALLPTTLDGGSVSVRLFEVAPGLTLGFELEPLGHLFALVSSGLWILNTLYSIGYMRGHGETDQTRFYALVAVAIGAAQGMAHAGDLFTLFLFYEVMTVSTYPLVAHKGDKKAQVGANTYLATLMITSIGLFLPAIIWTGLEAGTLAFRPGGVFPEETSTRTLLALTVLFAFGIGKAALVPVHIWLPRAMVAPTPVSALLHAVAVVKAGVFVMLKVMTMIFGTQRLAETGATDWLVVASSVSLIYAGVVACFQDNLKARLAYSTVSQLAYITLGASLATTSGALGGALQILMHAAGKITLFMCAGAILVGAHYTKLSEIGGLARADRKMRIIFFSWAVASLSIIGAPPLGGAWVKFQLVLGAAQAEDWWVAGVLLIGTLLAFGYSMPVLFKGFYGVEPEGGHKTSTPLLCVLPPAITAFLTFAAFVAINPVMRLLEPFLQAL